ncbi:MAG: CvpA family protein [Bacteroidales bacterium]
MSYIDIIILIIIIAGAVEGYRSGLINQIFSLVGLLISVFVAYKYSDQTYLFLQEFSDLSPKVLSIISFIVTFIVVLVVISLLGKLIDRIINYVFLGTINRISGALFSILKYCFVLSILIFVINYFDNNKTIFKQERIKRSYLYKPIKKFAPSVFPYLNKDIYKKIAKEPDTTIVCF